jgi:hypothetical protein
MTLRKYLTSVLYHLTYDLQGEKEATTLLSRVPNHYYDSSVRVYNTIKIMGKMSKEELQRASQFKARCPSEFKSYIKFLVEEDAKSLENKSLFTLLVCYISESYKLVTSYPGNARLIIDEFVLNILSRTKLPFEVSYLGDWDIWIKHQSIIESRRSVKSNDNIIHLTLYGSIVLLAVGAIGSYIYYDR